MIRIRPEQLEILYEYNREKFIEKNLKIIESLYLENSDKLSEDDLKNTANSIIEKCVEYDITREDHIMIFIGFALRWGEDFDTKFPWCKKVLKWNAAPEVKMQAMIFKFEKMQEEEFLSYDQK